MRKFARANSLLLMTITIVLGLVFLTSQRSVEADRQLPEIVQMTKLERPEIKLAKKLGPMVRETEMELTLALEMPDRAALDAFVDQLHDINSPNYHRWITPREFGERFGLAANDYQQMVDWLRGQGLKIKRTWPNRLAIDVTGTVPEIETAFRTEINNYEFQGKRYFAHSRAPQLPARIARQVLTIIGLENFSEPQPKVVMPAETKLAQPNSAGSKTEIGSQLKVGINTAVGPKDLYTAYNINPLLTAGVDGSGMTIAIAARSDFDLNDVKKFRADFDLPVNDPVKTFPSGPVNNLGGIEEIEVLLDVQLAGAAAPKATIMPIIAPKITESIQLIYNNFSNIPIVSISFGLCEERLLTENVKFFDMLYTQGVTQGQTTFVASGDAGVDDCRNGKPGVNGLASSPSAVAVGGTRLNAQFNSDGNSTGYGGEQAWNSGPASGGGSSMVFSKPNYQVGVGVPNDGKRSLPDISLLADPGGPGYFIIQKGTPIVIGGTSASAPVWAGMLALVEQFNRTGPLGNLNIRLYALGGNQANGGPTVYNDVTFGNNSTGTVVGFSAQPNYDLVTGWGSIDVNAFARNFLTQQNNLKPVTNLTSSADTSSGVVLNWQAPVLPRAEQALSFGNTINIADLNADARNQFQLPTFDLLTGQHTMANYRYGMIKPQRLETDSQELAGQLLREPAQQQTGNAPPEVTSLAVRLKGKNKAIADFTVSDPDGDLGPTSGVSIILFDRNSLPVAGARNGSILPFNDRQIFKNPLDFTGQTTGSFPFTLKGVKSLPNAALWISSLRDNKGNLSLVPGISGIAGRVSGFGQSPQIGNTFAAIFNNEDTVGINVDGTDLDSDTVGISVAYLDATGNVAFALGILGDRGFENFAPIALTRVNNPVTGQSNFMISFSVDGISKDVQPGTLKSVAVSLVDSNGNRSPMKIIPFGNSTDPVNGLLRYNIYRSKTTPVVLTPNNLIGSVASSSTSFTDKNVPGADGNTPFYYVVTAVYARGESPTSNEVMVKPRQ